MFRIPKIKYIDRATGEHKEEKVYGEAPLAFLYSPLGAPLRFLVTRFSLVSKIYGYIQAHPSSQKKVAPFIARYGLDPNEFQKQIFTSFNDFFIRRLKPEARPIHSNQAVMPADGRYRFFPNIKESDGHYIKGHKFSLGSLLQDESLASYYEEGSMVICRLAPVDYHRYHFPCSGIPSDPLFIKGHLSSVNPLPLSRNIHIFSHNRRSRCVLDSDHFGRVIIVEVGATCVGTIHQTYTPQTPIEKGIEKGFFSFGGSAIILLFEPGRITFDQDLLDFSANGLEVKCLMGQSLGRA